MRVITFSRFFPVSHPRKGERTLFVEKIMRGLHLWTPEAKAISDMAEWAKGLEKHHTIRAGDRWKVGDFFSPRVWSGKFYASKQIVIAPPIEIKKIWTFEWNVTTVLLNDYPVNSLSIQEIAMNDGLDYKDFKDWFNIHPKKKQEIFVGQILCWNENIEYQPSPPFCR